MKRNVVRLTDSKLNIEKKLGAWTAADFASPGALVKSAKLSNRAE